ncbi:hypothetical protein ACH4D8_04705 [Streptomyces roseolus]|uniref:hypothetical protein n=1 Tax=Streptomyces roseolus TaxID=67358 RepID=UPI0037AC4BF3
MLLVEVDRRIEDAHDLVQKLRRYWEWGRLLPKDAAKPAVDLVCSRPGVIEGIDHELRLWRRVCPPTGREGPVPRAFAFRDTPEAKVAHTVAVLEEADWTSGGVARLAYDYEEIGPACEQAVARASSVHAFGRRRARRRARRARTGRRAWKDTEPTRPFGCRCDE